VDTCLPFEMFDSIFCAALICCTKSEGGFWEATSTRFCVLNFFCSWRLLNRGGLDESVLGFELSLRPLLPAQKLSCFGAMLLKFKFDSPKIWAEIAEEAVGPTRARGLLPRSD